jgi:hypothetical protein
MSKQQIYTTAKGVAVYPHFKTPEVYDGQELGYTCKLLLEQEDFNNIETFLKGELEKAKGLPEFAGKKWSDPYIGITEDKDGNMLLKFKTVHQFVSKKTGDVIKKTLPIFDAAGKPLPDNINPANGSVVRIAFSILPYWKSAKVHGLSLRLEGVQVIDLKEYGGGNASDFGFGKEQGYEAIRDNESPFSDDDTEETDF